MPNNYDLEAASARIQAAQEMQVFTLVGTLGIAPFQDGDMWCVLWGVNLQEGVAGFGPTPREAVLDFNHNVYREQAGKEQADGWDAREVAGGDA